MSSTTTTSRPATSRSRSLTTRTRGPAVAVGRQGEEVELAGPRQLPDEIGEKADAPFQEGHEHDAVGIVARDLASEPAGDRGELVGVEQGPDRGPRAGSPAGQLAKRRLGEAPHQRLSELGELGEVLDGAGARLGVPLAQAAA